MSAKTDEKEEAGNSGQSGKEDAVELPVTQDFFTQEADDQFWGRNGSREQSSGSNDCKEMPVKTQGIGKVAALPTQDLSDPRCYDQDRGNSRWFFGRQQQGEGQQH